MNISLHMSSPWQVGLWISAGSRYESEKNNGAGFFLEHMAFKVVISCLLDLQAPSELLYLILSWRVCKMCQTLEGKTVSTISRTETWTTSWLNHLISGCHMIILAPCVYQRGDAFLTISAVLLTLHVRKHDTEKHSDLSILNYNTDNLKLTFCID